MNSTLLFGKVMHTRRPPHNDSFVYPVFYLLVDLDELPELDRALPLFGYNRFAPLTFHDADHLGEPSCPVKENLHAYLRENGVDPPEGKVYLLTFPRIFGHVFNPVSFFYCYDEADNLACIVAEVNNTWGERHPYLLTPENARQLKRDGATTYWADKVFYVSPFIEMDARYEFAFSPLQDRIYVHIDEYRQGRKFFAARLWGERVSMTNQALRKALLRYPFLTLMVVARIVWHAFKLWLRRVPIVPKPATEPSG
jgi:DUF1365 family protein